MSPLWVADYVCPPALPARVLRKLGVRVGSSAEQPSADTLREQAAGKLRLRANLTRAEVAAFLGVSTKKLQRMEARGTLKRCPGLGTVVRYRASDVLRLASDR